MANTAALTGINGLREIRRSPASHLAEAFEAGSVQGTVTLSEGPFQTMAGVRVDPSSEAGARIALRHRRPAGSAAAKSRGTDRVSVLWLGPQEFLVVAPEEAHDSLGGDLIGSLKSALGDGAGQVVDLSANRTTFELSGPRARAVLEKGCALDLHPRSPQAGHRPEHRGRQHPGGAVQDRGGKLPAVPPRLVRGLPGPLAPGRHEGVRFPRGALMALSALDLFSVGIGPSSSHTVGPMRAAKQFADGLKGGGLLSSTTRVQAELFGSLGATGRGHGSDKAVVLGLQGLDPETVDTSTADDQVAAAALDAELRIGGDHRVDFNWDEDVVLHRRKSLPAHPNGMTFRALDHAGYGAQRTELLLHRRRLRR